MDKKRIWGRSKPGFTTSPYPFFIHLELFRPLSERVLRRISVQQFSFLYHSPRAAPLKIFCRLSKAASSGCGKQYDRLSGKVITFKKCIDDRRCRVPPDRKSYEYPVIRSNIRICVRQLRPGMICLSSPPNCGSFYPSSSDLRLCKEPPA